MTQWRRKNVAGLSCRTGHFYKCILVHLHLPLLHFEKIRCTLYQLGPNRTWCYILYVPLIKKPHFLLLKIFEGKMCKDLMRLVLLWCFNSRRFAKESCYAMMVSGNQHFVFRRSEIDRLLCIFLYCFCVSTIRKSTTCVFGITYVSRRFIGAALFPHLILFL